MDSHEQSGTLQMEHAVEGQVTTSHVATRDYGIIPDSSGDEIFYRFAKTNDDRATIDTVMRDYPVRITHYLRTLIENSQALQKEYLPDPAELHTAGTPTPFEEGKEASHTYGLERVYRDRVLLTPHFDCPAYCRFCYKKSRVLRGQRSMTFDEIDTALAEVATMDQVRGILVTGGDPLMNPEKLFYLLDEASKLKNIFEIRVGTRTFLNAPQIFTNELCDRIASYNQPNTKDPSQSKYIAMNVHFNHPDELAPEVMEACHKIRSRGVTLRNQCVLLKGINDNQATIMDLFALLVRNNIIPYYWNHCMPVEGADHLRCSVARGLEIYRHLCTESSTVIPNYVYANRAGKVHLGPDSPLQYETHNGRQYIVTTMPYQADEFRRITHKELPPLHTENEDGFIRGTYMDGSDD